MSNALFFREGSLILMSLGGRSGHDIHHAHVGKVGASADALKAYSALREGNYTDALTYSLLGYGNLRASLENKDLVHSYRSVIKSMGRNQTERAKMRMAISATHFLYKRMLGVKHPIILLSGAAVGVAGKLWPSIEAAEASAIDYFAENRKKSNMRYLQQWPPERRSGTQSVVPTGKRPLGDLASLMWIEAFPFLKVVASDRVGYKAVRVLKDYPDLKVESGREWYGSHYKNSTITLDAALLAQEQTEETFLHEANHAEWEKTGKSVVEKVRDLPEEEFTEEMVKEEVASEIKTIKYRISKTMHTGIKREPDPLDQRYRDAHRQKVQEQLKTDRQISHMELAKAGDLAGAKAVYDGFKEEDNGTGVTYFIVYAKHYRTQWQKYHPET